MFAIALRGPVTCPAMSYAPRSSPPRHMAGPVVRRADKRWRGRREPTAPTSTSRPRSSPTSTSMRCSRRTTSPSRRRPRPRRPHAAWPSPCRHARPRSRCSCSTTSPPPPTRPPPRRRRRPTPSRPRSTMLPPPGHLHGVAGHRHGRLRHRLRRPDRAPATTEAPTTTTTEAPTTTRPPTTTTTESRRPPATTTTTAPPRRPPPRRRRRWPVARTPTSTPRGMPAGQVRAGGNWAANTGNGYYGGLQFSVATWHDLGGSGLPHEHGRATPDRDGQEAVRPQRLGRLARLRPQARLG